jgi:putative modified peptide
MSQAAVERILGKLITDDAFRDRFFANPAVASFAAGIELSGAELDALSRLPKKALARISKLVDDRICRVPAAED